VVTLRAVLEGGQRWAHSLYPHLTCANSRRCPLAASGAVLAGEAQSMCLRHRLPCRQPDGSSDWPTQLRGIRLEANAARRTKNSPASPMLASPVPRLSGTMNATARTATLTAASDPQPNVCAGKSRSSRRLASPGESPPTRDHCQEVLSDASPNNGERQHAAANRFCDVCVFGCPILSSRVREYCRQDDDLSAARQPPAPLVAKSPAEAADR
jgi:hypothetical protein